VSVIDVRRCPAVPRRIVGAAVGSSVGQEGARDGNEGGRSRRLSARRPVAVDLFAGAGGLSLGLEQAGFDVAAAVEYDPVHAAVHEFNFPLTEVLCRNVARLDSAELFDAVRAGRRRHVLGGRWDGEIDLVAGGPPCQGFSLIGKRLVDDPRNQLVFHFVRIVKELRPRYFLMENVPGMKVGGHSGILDRLINEIEEDGYRVVQPVEILNAVNFGVPQLRRRIFVIGARDDQPLPRYPAEAGSAVRSVDGSLTSPTVWDAIGDLPDLDKFEALWDTDEVELSAREYERAITQSSEYARALRGLHREPGDLSRPRVWNQRVLTSSMRTRHTQLSISRFSATHPGEVEPVSRFLRLHPAGLCNTLRAGTGSERGAYTSPRPIHPKRPRVISVREAARLHSFPDWFRLHRTKWHGFRQIGNAVAPRVGRAAGAAIADALRVAPSIPKESITLGGTELLSLTMAEAAGYFGVDSDAIPAQRTRSAMAA
jgi:DNA (cytosine-5)-methyltransferase 1